MIHIMVVRNQTNSIPWLNPFGADSIHYNIRTHVENLAVRGEVDDEGED